MGYEKEKRQIGINIANCRKRCGLTQAGLAERLNYSDKAVSKWERGESVPDVLTLMQLAEQFGVTVNDLVSDPDALPNNVGAVQKAMGKAVEKTLKRKADKRIILQLSSVLVWFIALFLFVLLSALDIDKTWMAFVYAIPVNAIVLLCLRSAWRDYRRNLLYVSLIVWGALVSIFASLWVFVDVIIWTIFLLGIPGQAAVILWGRLFRAGKDRSENG